MKDWAVKSNEILDGKSLIESEVMIDIKIEIELKLKLHVIVWWVFLIIFKVYNILNQNSKDSTIFFKSRIKFTL